MDSETSCFQGEEKRRDNDDEGEMKIWKREIEREKGEGSNEGVRGH